MIFRLIGTLFLMAIAPMSWAGELSGTATYRERIAMPPEATFQAILFDVTAGGRNEIGRYETSGTDGPPYQFNVEFDSAMISADTPLLLEVRVVAEGRPVFLAVSELEAGSTQVPLDLLMTRVTETNEKQATSPAGVRQISLPLTLTGTIETPAGSETWTLTLDENQSFQLLREFEPEGNEPSTRASLGRWRAEANGGTFRLSDGAEMPLVLKSSGAESVQVLDSHSLQPFAGVLVRSAEGERFDLNDMFLAGMMTYLADAAVFEECQSGMIFPIAQEGAYLDLEQAYLADRPAPGAPLYVMVEGGIGIRPAMEGPDRQMLVVDRFIRTRPGITCERQMADATLQNTYWRLDELEGAPFPQGVAEREPHLVLETGDESAYRATVGCNNIRGGYALTHDALSFTGGAMTMMACPDPLGQLERQFNAMLSEVVGYAIEGETLVLRDVNGTARAVFSAVYF